jgi:hypothetical protein
MSKFPNNGVDVGAAEPAGLPVKKNVLLPVKQKALARGKPRFLPKTNYPEMISQAEA